MTRTCLTQNTTWYVDYTNGNDSTGDGSSGNPWKTAQHAFETVQRNYDGFGYVWNIQLVDGDHYVPTGFTTFCGLNGPMVGAGGNSLTLNILGNPTTPDNCRINLAAGQYGFSLGNHFVGSINGFKFVCPTSGGVGAIPFFSSNYGSADIYNIHFGANPYNVNMYSVSLGTMLVYGPNSILGNTPVMYAAEEGGRIKIACDTAVPSAVAFTNFSSTSYGGAYIALTHATYSGSGVSGCTGRKGYASNTSNIRIDGNTSVGLGNTAFDHDSTSSTS